MLQAIFTNKDITPKTKNHILSHVLCVYVWGNDTSMYGGTITDAYMVLQVLHNCTYFHPIIKSHTVTHLRVTVVGVASITLI